MIHKSASKLAFIIMTVALCLFTGVGIIEPKDFMMLCSAVFSYYFGKAQTPPNN